MFAILPILIMLFIIAGSVLVYRKIVVSGKKFITSSKVYYILGGYVALLLVSVVVFLVSPYPETSLLSEELDTGKTPILYGIQYDIIEDKIPIENFSAYKDKEWEFELTGKELMIQSNPNDTVELEIIIEKKKEADGRVEVASYNTPTMVENLDLSQFISSTDVVFQNRNTLEIIDPYDEINVVKFSKEFIFNQFSKDNDNDEDRFSDYRTDLGERLLYIRIPKDVTVDAYDYLNIEYISE